MRYSEVYKHRRLKDRKKNYHSLIIFGVPVLILVFLIFFGTINPSWALSVFLKPISVFSQITGNGKLKLSDNRTNILILGLDNRSQAELGRTDTIIVASVGIKEGDVVLFSIPRDLWIKSYNSKINALHSVGGVALVQKTVEAILDLPINYYVVVDFAGFERAVDAVSGVDVLVERDFEDYRYPLPGKENDDCGGNDPDYTCRYEFLSFKKGTQTMDGKTALKFARSRESIGPEGSDFARSLRQQKIMVALKNKVLSLSTLVNPSTISKLYNEYKTSVDTNIGMLEAEKFYEISKKVKDEGVKSFVINKDSSGSDLLYNPSDYTPYGGQWVLLPKATDFSEVQTFVAKTLFGGN